jgi:hypothetical protein
MARRSSLELIHTSGFHRSWFTGKHVVSHCGNEKRVSNHITSDRHVVAGSKNAKLELILLQPVSERSRPTAPRTPCILSAPATRSDFSSFSLANYPAARLTPIRFRLFHARSAPSVLGFHSTALFHCMQTMPAAQTPTGGSPPTNSCRIGEAG